MGSFDETCAITRTAIHHYDEAYMVHWQGHKSMVSQEVIQPRERTTSKLFHNMRKEASWEEKYRDLPHNERPKVWYLYAKDVKLYKGTYDDYGWLEEHRDLIGVDRPPRIEYFFVHAFVVDAIREWARIDDSDPLETVRAIADYAHMTRTVLFADDWLLGEQYAFEDELNTQWHLLNLMRKGIQKIEDRWEL